MKKLILIAAVAFLSIPLFSQGLENLGEINGLSGIDTTSDATINLTEADCNNNAIIFMSTGAQIANLPLARQGLVVGFYDYAGTGVKSVDVATGDRILLGDTLLDVGDSIDSSGSIGDVIVLKAIDDTTWISWGPGIGFIDAGP